ncbi:hypothetical protein ThrDRAFT_02823 [Frankia casuarinae]|uniref:thiopeptide-type bacteriocin biosynthesis protein n=1 Tax=Frankia TaxID=1854 RepID=UPI0002ECF5E8|nr:MULTISPECIES: thiopeptide-type bacteriocin biosynthesis protein [Frankia]EYT91488.1 hypothetical protein ThrDRAFT_02823 [Frankia casuarinae]KDA41223.1 hypothetical protein BMG523Draft_03957 [Frankia sp. BMG5.23]
MSTDRLTPGATEEESGTEGASLVDRDVERAVLKLLTGIPLNEAAGDERMKPAELAEAAAIYQRSGRQALHQQVASDWWQIYIEFTDWHAAEQAAARYIAPLLHRAGNCGIVAAWWFMRKYPCWRIRLRPGPTGTVMKASTAAALDELVTEGRIARWWTGTYEAETAAFGGGVGIDIAHRLFCADSNSIMNLSRNPDAELGRRELSLLLSTCLLRAAGLEWYEQGDVWHRVTLERPLPADVPTSKLTAMISDLKRLMLVDTTPDGPLLHADGPLAYAAGWADAFRQAGQSLGSAARTGTLERGLRDVASYLTIFHWNRLGLPSRTQSTLAWAARAAILGPPTGATKPLPAMRRIGTTMQRGRPTLTVDGDAERAVARFPLVEQHRFRCTDLEARVRSVRECAESCHEPTDPHDRINLACTVWNLSALIAADCGVPDLAVDLCRRQFLIFQAALPLSGSAIIAALQPLVNLTRLTRRAGNPGGAHHELNEIERAARTGSDALIHGERISFRGFITADSEYPKAAQWMRVVMLDDGTRNLVAAGRWEEAAAHAARYDDAQEMLRESRQARIIAHVRSGHTDPALALIDSSVVSQPWETAVAACLRAYINIGAARRDNIDLEALLGAVRSARFSCDRPTTMFHLRLGLTAVDLASSAAVNEGIDLQCAELIDMAEHSADAFVARELLGNPVCRARMTSTQTGELSAYVARAGLDAGSIPGASRDDLLASVQTATTVLVQALDVLDGREAGG